MKENDQYNVSVSQKWVFWCSTKRLGVFNYKKVSRRYLYGQIDNKRVIMIYGTNHVRLMSFTHIYINFELKLRSCMIDYYLEAELFGSFSVNKILCVVLQIKQLPSSL